MHHESRNSSLPMFLSARQKFKSWLKVGSQSRLSCLRRRQLVRDHVSHPRRETFSRNLKKIFLNSSTPRFLYYLCTCRQIGRTLA